MKEQNIYFMNLSFFIFFLRNFNNLPNDKREYFAVLFDGGRTSPAAPLKVKEKESIDAPIQSMAIQAIKIKKMIYYLFLEYWQRVALSI